MKPIQTILFVFLFCSFRLSAQVLIVNWTKFIGGTNGYTQINSALATDDGGLICTGLTTVNNTGIIPGTTFGKENIFVGKFNKSFQLDWIKLYGGNNDDEGIRICKSNDGGFVVLSRVMSGDGDISGFKGTTDIWLLKIDANGNKLWSKTYGSAFSEEALSISPTSDNGYIVLGASNGSGDDIPSHYTTSQFVHDWFVLKLDEFGNKEWIKSIGGTKGEHFYGKIFQVDTSYYFASSSESTDYDCNDISWHGTTPTDYNYYLIKLDKSGNVLWNRSYGGTGFDFVNDALFDEGDNSIIIAGYSASHDYMAAGTFGAEDAWVIKVGLDGNLKWSKKYGGNNSDVGTVAVVKGKNNGYMLYFNTYSDLNLGSQDTWAYSIENNGDAIKQKIIGGKKAEFAFGLCTFESGYILYGSTGSDGFTEGINGNIPSMNACGYMTKLEFFPSGINDTKIYTNLKISPNPAKNAVTIETGNNTGELIIADINGKIIYSQKIERFSHDITLDTRNYTSGMYIVKINNCIGQFVIN